MKNSFLKLLSEIQRYEDVIVKDNSFGEGMTALEALKKQESLLKELKEIVGMDEVSSECSDALCKKFIEIDARSEKYIHLAYLLGDGNWC